MHQTKENEPFYSCIFNEYPNNDDVYFEITRYWEKDFKNKFIVGFFSLNDENNTKKILEDFELTKLFENKQDVKDKYHGRYYKTFKINEEESLIKFVKDVFKKLRNNKN